ncbi:MAG: 4Fe-4S dicluster domain-containing protein [Bacteroidales bacterium]|nr:MAG: 4Fe-4S dicluster domain-containing protein [Bacteroidales bacterium]
MKKSKRRNTERAYEDSGFIRDIISSREGARVLSCIQCGTCSASCPVFEVMDYPPRKIFAMIREGMKDKVLLSVTPWICASCYRCTVNCPAQIKITEVMYELKRICLKEQVISERTDANRFYSIFLNQIIKYGRSHELGLMIKFMMLHHPVNLLQQVPRGVRMMLSGSLSLFPHRIKNAKTLQKITDHALKLQKV